MKIKEENYKTIDLFSYCKSFGLSDIDSNYLIEKLNGKTYNEKIKTIKRLKREPIQYIVGHTNFYGYDFFINKNVLIPRFETEELVDNTIKIIKNRFDKDVKVLDLGTGSGCIGITLKKELPYVDVTLSDISKKALIVAKENSKGLNINLVKGNMLNPFIKNKNKFNVIISNPPYIAKNEFVDKLVKNNEPNMALYAKNNGLYFYEKILKKASKVLEKDFLIAFEIGMNQKDDIIRIANKYFNKIEIISKKDLQGRERMIFIQNLTNK